MRLLYSLILLIGLAIVPVPSYAQHLSSWNTVLENAIALRDVIGDTLAPAMSSPNFADMMFRLQDRRSTSTVLMPVKSVWEGAVIDDRMKEYYTKLLRYHIVPHQAISSAMLQSRGNTDEWIQLHTAFMDEPLYIRRVPRGSLQLLSSGGSVVNVLTQDIHSANGIIHLIDGALFPRGFSMGADRQLYVEGVNAPMTRPRNDFSVGFGAPGPVLASSPASTSAPAPAPAPSSLLSPARQAAPVPADSALTSHDAIASDMPVSPPGLSEPLSGSSPALATLPAATSVGETSVLDQPPSSIPVDIPVPLYTAGAAPVPTYAPSASGGLVIIATPVGLVSTPMVPM